MKSRTQKIFKAALLITVYCSLNTTFAQAPEKMSYQAVIRDASNTLLVNQPIGMQVSIMQGSANGTEVYRELFNPNPQTNINGLVTVEIGTGIPLTGTFSDINWSNGPYFIKTETDPTGGTNYTIVGTSQLLSTPYALYAKTSGNAGWGLNGNSGTNASANFIGTTDDTDIVFKRNDVLSGKISGATTSFGLFSLYDNTTGTGNTALGREALSFNTIGSNNTATGLYALSANSSGNGNTASGVSALASNSNGSFNTANGNSALLSNTTGISNTANGASSLSSNTTGQFNSAYGVTSLFSNVSGSNNVALGYSTLYNLTSGSNNTGIGAFANVPSSTGSNQVRIGNTLITYAGTQVAWSVTSDSRWKENIQPSNLGLQFINDLKPVFYTRKNDDTKKVEYGIIAQELEASLNKFGADTNGIITKDDEGMYSVRYNDLLAPMIKAIQEQQAMIEALKAEIEELKSKE